MRAALDTRLRWALAAALLAAAVAGLLTAGPFGQDRLAELAIFALFAIALDLAAGLMGLMSIGHALFFGVGAYGMAVLTGAGLSPGLATLLSVAAALAAGAAIGALIVRFPEVVFITLTLAFAEMFDAFIFGNRFLGGSDGLSGAPRLDLSLLGLDTGRPATFAAVCVLCAAAGFLLIDAVVRSPFGLVAAAARQNPARAQALGAPLAAVRTAVFAASAGLAGLAGALLAQLNGFVSPDLAGWALSGLVLIMAILGGLGSVSGAALGAVLVQEASHDVSRWTGYWGFWLGILFVAVVLLAENGLFALLRRAALFRRP